MAFTRKLNSTYMKYFVPGKLDPEEIRLVTHKGNEVSVFYKTDYNTYIPNAINYIVGLFAHWNRKRTRPQSHVYISNKNLAKNIGCSYGHASYIMDQIEEIFKLDVTHERGRSRSRSVRITSTLIDFMRVFSDEDLEDFILEHKINSEQRFPLQQVYRYLGWGIAPAQLSPEEKKARKEYMSDEERRNYWHYAATSSEKVESRLKDIQDNLHLLSETQQKQFDHLKKAHKPGEKLIKYWFQILLKLQQIVSWLTRDQEKAHDDQQQTTSVNNENTNKDASVAHKSATAEHQKKPEPIKTAEQKLQFIGKMIVSWNERAERNNLPLVKRITSERYNSLLTLMEEYKESEILEALAKIEVIHQGDSYDHKFTFSRFIQSETVLYALEYDSNSLKALQPDVMEQIMNNINIKRSTSTVPEFTSIKHLNTWLREQNL